MSTFKLKPQEENVFTNVMTLADFKKTMNVSKVHPRVAVLKKDGEKLKKGDKTAFLVLGETNEGISIARKLIPAIEDKSIASMSLYVGDLKDTDVTMLFARDENTVVL